MPAKRNKRTTESRINGCSRCRQTSGLGRLKSDDFICIANCRSPLAPREFRVYCRPLAEREFRAYCRPLAEREGYLFVGGNKTMSTTLGATTIAMQGKLDKVIQGDDRAKKELIDLAYERLLIVARKLLGSFVRVRVEEETAGVLSEAYFRLHSSLDDVKPQTVRQFMGLAALEIRRVLLDKIRQMDGRGKKKRQEPVRIDARPAGAEASGAGFDIPDDDFDSSRQHMAIDLLEAIAKLPDDEREAVEFLFFHGLSQAETAEILDVDESTVKRRWARARVKLAEKLSAFG